MKLYKIYLFIVVLITNGIMSAVSADTFTVNDTRDAADILPGDGICQTNIPAQCTIRAATQETNALAGADNVIIPAGVFVLSIGQLSISDDLTLAGAGADSTILDGGGTSRVLIIENPPAIRRITVTVEKVTVQNGSDSGILVDFASALNLADSIVRNNAGGVFNSIDGVLNVTNCTISYNSRGGISNSGSLIVSDSTVSDNERTGISSSTDLDEVTIINSTLSRNGGSGIANSFGTVTVISSTVNDNLGGISNAGGPIIGVVTLKNTLVANSFFSDCLGEAITSGGHNLSSDNTCGFTSPGDLVDTDPILGPLQNNGGPTATHALLSGSPAIDAGSDPCTDPTGAPLLTDQRGAARPVDGNGDGMIACDIGSYELQSSITTVDIDIKPGNENNIVNPRAKGGIWIAVLSDTDPASPFDPSSQVDIQTVEFGPDGAMVVRHKVEDINKDRLGDLLLRFKVSEAGLACGDTEATLTGETFDGQGFTGTDSIKTVGCKPK